MNSATKNHQTEDTIKKMVASAFSDQEVIEVIELKEGFFNVAYLIKLSDGEEVILKIAPPKDADIMTYEKNLMLAEVESMKLINESTQIPIPKVLFYSTNKSENEFCNSQYFFMSKIEGSNYHLVKKSLPENQRKQIDFELGQYNRAMNEVVGNRFGYFASEEEFGSDWKTVFQRMLLDVFQDGRLKNSDIGMDYDALWEDINDKLFALDTYTTPRFVHWDLWDGNVFVKDGHVEGIIDFERALWGDPLMEASFRKHNVKNQKSDFLDGYGIVEDNQDAKIRCILYDIYLYLIMIIECDYRNYEDTWQYGWSKDMLADAVKCLNTTKEYKKYN